MIGVRHDCESSAKDYNHLGSCFIKDVLNEINPDLIIFEDGYNYFKKRPAKRNDRQELYGVSWAKEHHKKFLFTDLKEPIVETPVSWAQINKAREEAIKNKVLNQRENFTKIVLFVGENHRQGIGNKLSGSTVISFKMPGIRQLEVFLTRFFSSIIFILKTRKGLVG